MQKLGSLNNFLSTQNNIWIFFRSQLYVANLLLPKTSCILFFIICVYYIAQSLIFLYLIAFLEKPLWPYAWLTLNRFLICLST